MVVVAGSNTAKDDLPTNGFTKQTFNPPSRMNKYNPLPALGRRTASRARLPPNTSAGNNTETLIKDEETVTTTVHSQVTQRLPITSTVTKHISAAPKNVGKSLPRLGGNIKRLDKINLKGKNLLGEDDLREDSTNPSPSNIAEGENAGFHGPNTTFIKHFAKTMAGYSEGKAKTNQDAIYVHTAIKDSTNASIFAVFDGHGMFGHKVSGFLKDKLTGRRWNNLKRLSR